MYYQTIPNPEGDGEISIAKLKDIVKNFNKKFYVKIKRFL
jgi:hypothetical protein